MWLLKKAGEFIAPKPDTDNLTEFKSACSDALSSLSGQNSDDLISFRGALNNVQDYLSEEIDSSDRPCLDFFVSTSVMQQIVDSIDNQTPTEHIEPIFEFFSAFIETELNKHFFQITVHRPFTKLLSLLEVLYRLEPSETRSFAAKVWSTLRPLPIMLEMLSMDGKYPLLDFFFILVFSPQQANDFARDAVLSILSGAEPELPPSFTKYVLENLYPKFVDFILQMAESVTTLQFNSPYGSLARWIDSSLSMNGQLDTHQLFEKMSKFDDPHQLLAMAMILSFFMAPAIFDKSVQFATTDDFINKTSKCLRSDQEFDKKAAITFLKTLIRCNPDNCAFMIPPIQNETADVLSLLQPEWLIQNDGSSAMEAYENDAVSRINLYGQKRADGCGSNVFGIILSLLADFKGLSLSLCLSLSELILMLLANAPDLISTDLAKSYEQALSQYKEVPYFQMPIVKFSDTPEVRAAILTEFGKEIHATFIASEKIRTEVERFNHE